MRNQALAALLFAALSLPAIAASGGEGGNTGCNGQGNPNSPCTPSTGGAGGNATGGTGIGVGVGIANAAALAQANAAAAANASNTNNIKNTNTQGQQQGQVQGQQQSSRNTNTSRNNNQSSATGGAATATGGASGGNTLATGAVNVAVEGAKGDVVYAPAQERNPVATAYAAPLTVSNGTCMGSSSGGVQVPTAGISFGTTWKDDDCDRRYDANSMVALGTDEDKAAARALLQQKPSIQKAYDDARNGKRADAILNGRTVIAEVATPQPVTDVMTGKIIGLPPLK